MDKDGSIYSYFYKLAGGERKRIKTQKMMWTYQAIWSYIQFFLWIDIYFGREKLTLYLFKKSCWCGWPFKQDEIFWWYDVIEQQVIIAFVTAKFKLWTYFWHIFLVIFSHLIIVYSYVKLKLLMEGVICAFFFNKKRVFGVQD